MTVDIVVPVYNEEHSLERSVRRLRAYLDESFPFDAIVTVADNASTDCTWQVARRLEAELAGVRALHLGAKGRGRALRAAWSSSDADIVAYMDVDLSTGLDALLPLVAPLASGHSDVAIGSRLANGAHVIRGPKRELVSRGYNVLLRVLLRNRFSDAQCGFKAMRAEDARTILPAVEDDEWFFDTELLILAERNGLRIHEVPVDWEDDPDSRVQIAQTARADLKGVVRLAGSFARGNGKVAGLDGRRSREMLGGLASLVGVGVFNTIAYLVVYLLVSSQMNHYVANIVSLALCSVANLAARWRYSLRARAAVSLLLTATSATMAFSTSAVLTTWCLAAATNLDRRSSAAQIGALLVGTAIAALFRFSVLGAVVFHMHVARPAGQAGSSSEDHSSSTP